MNATGEEDKGIAENGYHIIDFMTPSGCLAEPANESEAEKMQQSCPASSALRFRTIGWMEKNYGKLKDRITQYVTSMKLPGDKLAVLLSDLDRHRKKGWKTFRKLDCDVVRAQLTFSAMKHETKGATEELPIERPQNIDKRP